MRSTAARPQIVPGFGVTEIASDPNGAEIFLDDKFVGASPATLHITAGVHELILKLAQHTDWSRSIIILKDSTVTAKPRSIRFRFIRCKVVASMTPDEAREMIIEGMNYAAHKETDSSLRDAGQKSVFRIRSLQVGSHDRQT